MTRHVRTDRRSPWVITLAILLLVVASVGAAAAALRPWDTTATITAGDPGTGADPAPVPTREPTPTPTPTPTPDPDAEFTIVAAGDVLPHLPVLADARVARRRLRLQPAAGTDEPVDPGR